MSYPFARLYRHLVNASRFARLFTSTLESPIDTSLDISTASFYRPASRSRSAFIADVSLSIAATSMKARFNDYGSPLAKRRRPTESERRERRKREGTPVQKNLRLSVWHRGSERTKVFSCPRNLSHRVRTDRYSRAPAINEMNSIVNSDKAPEETLVETARIIELHRYSDSN